jgi:hypothetical protein
MAEIGTTILVASIREVGHAFHDNRTPVLSYIRYSLLQFPQTMPFADEEIRQDFQTRKRLLPTTREYHRLDVLL